MKARALYLRTIIFGVTDSLVSTVGLLAGIGVAGVPQTTIILAGVVYAFVEAFSMAVGNFLSEQSAEEYADKSHVPSGISMIAGVVMFVASVLAAFIPLFPYLLFTSWVAFALSIAVSILTLFVMGIISAHFSQLPILWRGTRMALLGGAAILMGVVVGSILPAA